MLPHNLFRRIAPVGNPISLKISAAVPTLLDDQRIRLVQSGTAALAAAVSVAKMAKPVDGKPEVIIPAYCCPDVVAAIVYNNCTPVLVDFIADRPHMDIDAIDNAITANTIAVIAVNFLGIAERCKQIRAIIAPHNIVLIEDSAQWFPEQGSLFDNYEGDLVVLSFGKGKPVSLLGGGAVICRNTKLPFDRLQVAPASRNRAPWQLQIMFFLYDLVIHPLFYWLLEMLPIGLGATRYKPLATIEEFEPSKRGFLARNIDNYRNRSRRNQQAIYTILTTRFGSDISVAHQCSEYSNQTLLRLPVLLHSGDNAARSTLLALKQNGLGITALYGSILPHIENIPLIQSTSSYPNADRLAKALLTLPTHLYAGHLNELLQNMNSEN